MAFRIWSNNPLSSRDDLFSAFDELFEPLLLTFLPGGARSRISEAGSSCLEAAAEFEGYLRPLWGIVPYQCGGKHFPHWELYRRGLVNGTNPDHEEYWGHPQDYDQLLVDLAAVGYALCFVLEHIWDPLLPEEKAQVAQYLLEARDKNYCHNNWKFFRVLVDLGLRKVGVEHKTEGTKTYLDDLDSLYLGDGWYGDGKRHRIDNYNALAFHFYSLVYVVVMKNSDPERCKTYVDRATLFAHQYIHWFNENGQALPYGRSLIYRFATSGFWGIFPLVLDTNKEPPIPWSVMRSLYLRSLQWWAKQPINERGSKFLSLGYTYPNSYMMERYNSPQSPYWSFKCFTGMLVPQNHPFWSSGNTDISQYFAENRSKQLTVVGMAIEHQPSNTTVLVNGPWNDEYQTEKYSKFAYSTRFGFGVVSNHRTFPLAHLDNSLGFSFNNEEFYVRQDYEAYTCRNGYLLSLWKPTDGIKVKTWMVPKTGYHLRMHFIENETGKTVHTIEGGFALQWNGRKVISRKTDTVSAGVSTETDQSEIINLGDSRTPVVCVPEPNTNVLFSKALLPELVGDVGPKSSATFASLVFGQCSEYSRPVFETELPERDELDVLESSATRVECNTPEK